MGIYIKNMEMPKSCLLCPFVDREKGLYSCDITGQYPICDPNERSCECPLIEVPEQKHGQWIRSVDELGEAWMCSECLEEFFPADGMDEFISYVHYCPNCGAAMEGE